MKAILILLMLIKYFYRELPAMPILKILKFSCRDDLDLKEILVIR